jgi:CubicO group peptidase (beta-lactamase class C family)
MTREQTVGGFGAADDPVRARHYAPGWAKADPRTGPASPASFGHSGVTGTRLWVDPPHDLVVVYLTGARGFPLRLIDEAVQAGQGSVPTNRAGKRPAGRPRSVASRPTAASPRDEGLAPRWSSRPATLASRR